MIANLKQKYGENWANMKKLIVDLPKKSVITKHITFLIYQ
jgi:hypothetical protein